MGLPRTLRLTRSEDFSRARQSGQTVRGRLLLLNVVPNQLAHNRYGIVTGKRLGSAVARNRARRVVRAALRRLHAQLRTGWDVVVVPHPPLFEQPFAEVVHALERLARQAGLTLPSTPIPPDEGGRP
ncbi:MAG: ribonuclease P protein component [Anaerolineae bacterium]|nr:ribonuclease P protein component [Anaerolineae bacterium]